MMGPTIDMIWVGRLGSASIAGVGISTMVVMMVGSLMMGLFTGLRAMVARFIGAGDASGANNVMQQAFVIGAVFSIFTATIGLFLAEQILLVFGVEPDVVTEGAAYLRILLVGMVSMFLLRITEASMQASGDAVTPMRVAIFYRVLHVVLVPFLVLGWWIFPRLGVSGAALANVISQSLGGAFGLWFLFSGRTRLRPTLRDFHPDRNTIWRMVKVGFPASITGVQRSLPYLVLVWFVSPFGTFALAAYQLTRRIADFVMNPAAALGSSTGILAGQNLGAGQPERAEKNGWLAVGFFTGAAAVISAVVWFWAEPIISIFNGEPGLVETAATFLRIQIASYMIIGVVVVLSMCMEGAGDTFPIMLATLLSMWLIQAPLGYFLTQVTGIGVYGVQWAITGALLGRGTFFAIYFRLGRWKRKKI